MSFGRCSKISRANIIGYQHLSVQLATKCHYVFFYTVMGLLHILQLGMSHNIENVDYF